MSAIAAIVGPTASGKTALAVALAQRGLPLAVVCCDATQLVAGIDAATAKPDAAERAAVPHWLLDTIAPTEALSAGRYAALADGAIAAIHSAGAWPVLVGGTGLYLRAVVDGLADIPATPHSLRAELAAEAAARGPQAMWAELSAVDPAYAARTPAANRQRVLRALEVARHTGRAFSTWHGAGDPAAARAPRHRCLTLVLAPPRAWLATRLAARAEAMVDALLREAQALREAGMPREAPGLAALGYRQAWDLAAGAVSDADRAALAAALVRGHRDYAKRQRTYFAGRADAITLDPSAPGAVEQAEGLLRAHFLGPCGEDAPAAPSASIP